MIASLYQPKDAYFHISIHQDLQQMIHFAVGERHFQFVCLPFGLTTAPSIFTKVLVSLIAFLKLEVVLVLHYLDDILVLVDSHDGFLRYFKFLHISSMTRKLSCILQLDPLSSICGKDSWRISPGHQGHKED